MPWGRELGLAASFGHSLLAWHVDGAPRPISATFAVTNRCNLRCTYCNTPFLDPRDLPLEQVEIILERLHTLGVRRLGLTGGEPMVRKDLPDIVAQARRLGFFVTLNTNLMLYQRRPEVVRGVDLFFTSLDGPREHHEAARGPGSYDGVVEAARALAAAGQRVVAICVVTEHNIGHAEPLLRLADRSGFRVHFQPQCTDTDIVRGRLARDMTSARYRAFFRDLLAHKRAGLPVASTTPYLEALAGWDDFTTTAVLDPAVRCTAGWAFLYVDPQGRAYPCAYTKGKTEPVDLLGPGWRSAVGRSTPCTRCSVGPYLEMNLLYQRPARAVLGALRSYG